MLGQMSDTNEVPLEAKVFAFLFQAIKALSRGAFPAANKLIEFVLRLADGAPSAEADAFRALGFCAKVHSLEKEGRRDEAVSLRGEAMSWVDRVSNEGIRRNSPFPQLMSALLVDLLEYRRAIPFCEMAVQQELEANEPIAVAQMLSREGRCYSLCGLKDQATIPMRAALKILRDYPGEP